MASPVITATTDGGPIAFRGRQVRDQVGPNCVMALSLAIPVHGLTWSSRVS